jgi:hypothetical protein
MNVEWVSCTGRDLAKDPTLVQRGDLIEYELWEAPDGPVRFRTSIKVAQVRPGSQVEIGGCWQDTTYFERHGSVRSSASGSAYASICTARWKQITMDQRAELSKLAHFTNGGGGRPRRP